MGALCATVVVWVTFESAPQWLSPDTQCVFFLAWSLPTAAWIAHRLIGTAQPAARRPVAEPVVAPLAAAHRH